MSLRTDIVKLREKGLSFLEIARELHVSRNTVAGHIWRHRNGYGEAKPREPKERRIVLSRRDMPRRRGPNRATDVPTRLVMQAIEESNLYDWEIAERAGIDKDTIRKWRAGRKGHKFLLDCVMEVLRE